MAVPSTNWRQAARRDHPVHRLVEDLQHPGNPEERPGRTQLVPGPGRRRDRAAPALHGGVEQHPGGAGLRHPRGKHPADVGLGRRALLAVVGDRHLQLQGAAGPAGHLVRQLPGRAEPRDPALRPLPEEYHQVPAATGHGIQRQVRAPRRQRRAWSTSSAAVIAADRAAPGPRHSAFRQCSARPVQPLDRGGCAHRDLTEAVGSPQQERSGAPQPAARDSSSSSSTPNWPDRQGQRFQAASVCGSLRRSR